LNYNWNKKKGKKMKKLSMILMVCLILLFAGNLNAQSVTDKQVSLSWDAGTEPDIQYYQLYVSTSGDDAEYGPVGDPISFNPNDPTAPATLSASYTFQAPAGAVTTRWFKVTAIDTSGNESAPSEAVLVSVDNEPPSAPTGIRVAVIINVVQ
jgi:fibronectin type 3 domain-containing protein